MKDKAGSYMCNIRRGGGAGVRRFLLEKNLRYLSLQLKNVFVFEFFENVVPFFLELELIRLGNYEKRDIRISRTA